MAGHPGGGMSDARCPCCGAFVEPASVLVDLNSNTVTRFGRTIPLYPTEAEILAVLQRRYPARIERGALLTSLYGLSEEPSSSNNLLSVRVSFLRRKIAALGLRIPAGYSGYRLEIEDMPLATSRVIRRRVAA